MGDPGPKPRPRALLHRNQVAFRCTDRERDLIEAAAGAERVHRYARRIVLRAAVAVQRRRERRGEGR